MRIAITGASGNAGTALLRRLQKARQEHPGGLELVGISRRTPDSSQPPYAGVEWHALDVGSEGVVQDLVKAFAGADAAVHLAWQIQPNRDLPLLHRTNVTGTANVLAAAREAGVGHVVCASSVGAYSKSQKDRRVDESWPAGGMDGSHYSRHKAEQEKLLDRFAADNPSVAVARLRPGLIFQAKAGSEIGRYFLGWVHPRFVPRRPVLPILPIPDELIFQAVHADDVAEAYWRVLERRASGAFNVAAEPVVTPQNLARLFSAKRILRVPVRALHAFVGATWQLRLQQTDSGWVEMAAGAPIMDTQRIRNELGWEPQTSSLEAIREVIEGMGKGAGVPASPPLKPRRSLLGLTRRR
ncbi:NAD-dependent epimerase/dehydratase family protein [Arthrobacter sp. AFG20]|uniref:NAD-dependent epimerase/dehydratase family protein n=1 Tax=Arthrobacter sp. AFG20 TaxID=1688671 RepID=UPI000C9E8D84|nr:NAD-dependent epimerase/dehydratase family protein [Arthrobacter sp. AFG20]PNH83563.1 epimerase [Arthrobacter sp. AFG20]